MALSSIFAFFSLAIAVLGVFVGILNYSKDDAYMYRYMFETELVTNKENFYFGCFCLTNKFDGKDRKPLQIGNVEFCERNGCTNEILIENNKFYKDWILQGDVGVGESYFNGYWTYNHDLYDLGDVITEFVLGITNGTQSVFTGKYAKYLIVEQWKQWYDRKYGITKSIDEDKSSVSRHYDVGNDLYESFLDPTMTYSCAFWGPKSKFPNAMTTIDAQNNKINLLAAKMSITNDDNVLEIGSGWGYAAYSINKQTNANVTAITTAEEQFAYQKSKYGELSDRGGGSQLAFKLLDYRQVDELAKLNINKIISIAMFEHVGLSRINDFFATVSQVFDASMKFNKQNGKKSKQYVFGLHYYSNADITPGKIEVDRAIACDQQTYIFKYIFPGQCLIHPDWVIEVARNHGFLTLHQESFGYHYGKTLKLWREKWRENFDELAKSNPKYDKRLYLLYEVYFAFCEAMFRTGHVQLWHMVFIKMDNGGSEDEVRKTYSRLDNIYESVQLPERELLPLQ